MMPYIVRAKHPLLVLMVSLVYVADASPPTTYITRISIIPRVELFQHPPLEGEGFWLPLLLGEGRGEGNYTKPM